MVFGDIPPVLVNNSLYVWSGGKIALNTDDLGAYDRNHNNNTLVFIPSNVSHGQFEATDAPGVALVNFTQQQIRNGTIEFVHDGTLVAPTYDITVRSDGIAWTGPSPANITFGPQINSTVTPTGSFTPTSQSTPTSTRFPTPTLTLLRLPDYRRLFY